MQGHREGNDGGGEGGHRGMFLRDGEGRGDVGRGISGKWDNVLLMIPRTRHPSPLL